ncbi:hypothetical protein ACET3X_002090 [Alternaria dauci]|uniref:Uncharacterized protein n=1 Tax=Alternaria dauci TaxID=48095 RepID=A0ABR3UZY4_9PLEO
MNPAKDQHNENPTPHPVTTQQGSLDHVLDVLALHNHPFLLVGCAAQRWMGSNGNMTNVCEIVIRNDVLDTIASDLLATRKWKLWTKNPEAEEDAVDTHAPISKCDADIVFRRVHIENANEFAYLALWSEDSYHITVDECASIQVPDVYSWSPILVEDSWHPALHRDNGWWYGPRVRPDTKAPFPSSTAHPNAIFFPSLPRGRSAAHTHSISVPSLPAYLDALVYHVTHYKVTKPGLWAVSSWQLRNLTRYLYLELDHQQLALLIEMDEYDFMDDYLERFVRKPRFVYGMSEKGEFGAARVREWNPGSYPEWCRVSKRRECVCEVATS